MNYYIGIDLGTTNSSICSYDGQHIRIWKSPEQSDVTPSAIYIDKRGNRYYGSKAYNQASYNPNNSATLFKRFMGTNTRFELEAANLSLTPEECSAEILKVLFGYLPDEIRNNPDTATVITVPAAFNQMKKDATLHAATLAGIGKVALMQEPVAAIMSVMRTFKQEGIFLVYDLGGGTFDVSVAESMNGKVNLLSHGGIEMCGGRDMDRMIFNNIVLPWLKNNFKLPHDFIANKKYKPFCRIAQWAAERAKIELSSAETASISLSEYEARTVDEEGNELYLDIELSRRQVDVLISDLIDETIDATKETLRKSGIALGDVERIVFIGGPTMYKPLRDRVASELSLPTDIYINPMTAVAEGACIFAESIDWSTETHSRKASTDIIETSIDLSFKYISRTSGNYAKVMCVSRDGLDDYSIEFTSADTGWSSGNASLTKNYVIDLPLSKDGENRFSVKVLDKFGRKIPIGDSNIVITKTLATVGAIPASHSVAVEVIEKLGGTPTLAFLVKQGDALPKKGEIVFKAGRTLKAGSFDSLNIKLWEGDILSPITDNLFIGVLKITGKSIPSGVIPTGADIECEYEMSDSGTITLNVSVPCVGAYFGDRNFYSRQEGQLNLQDVGELVKQGLSLNKRIQSLSELISDKRLYDSRKAAIRASRLLPDDAADPELIQQVANNLHQARVLVNKVAQDNAHVLYQRSLDICVARYERMKIDATPEQGIAFNTLLTQAKQAIKRNDPKFSVILDSMNKLCDNITSEKPATLDDEEIRGIFLALACMPESDFTDVEKSKRLIEQGSEALGDSNISRLIPVILSLLSLLKEKPKEEESDLLSLLNASDDTNILFRK